MDKPNVESLAWKRLEKSIGKRPSAQMEKVRTLESDTDVLIRNAIRQESRIEELEVEVKTLKRIIRKLIKLAKKAISSDEASEDRHQQEPGG